MQIKESPTEYDVCVVGSGAGGGMAAKVLTEAGAKVALLEAGPMFDSVEADMFAWPYQSPRRGAPTHRPFGEFDAAYGGWEIDGEPYTTAPGTEFGWFRSRMLGGRTNHYGRISLRFGPKDFQRKSVDGLGDNWPITYDDIKPYYDEVDKMIGVFGANFDPSLGLVNEPDGIFQPPPKPRAYELLVQQACDPLGIPVLPSRLSILTRPLNGRPACHYCAQCNRSCSTHSNFSSPSVLIPPAMKTGNLTLITNAMAREVLTDDEGQATGVSYVSKDDGLDYTVRAKIVVLAASSCETARIMLNSKSSRHPNGLGNSSELVGRYLMDSTGSGLAGVIPKMMNGIPYNEDGTGGMHMYMPWWKDNMKDKLDFPRGYHIEIWGGRRMPSYGFGNNLHAYNGWYSQEKAGGQSAGGGGGYGKSLKEDYRRYYGAVVGFAGRGEPVASKNNYCEIDPNVVDQWGIPVLRFDFKWSDYEKKQAKHMVETFEEIIHAMGGRVLGDVPGEEDDYGLLAPGKIIHEVGTARMGKDPKQAPVNEYCQSHDCKNLFVADGSSLVTNADKNPTWTILALSMRTSEYITDQRKQRSL